MHLLSKSKCTNEDNSRVVGAVKKAKGKGQRIPKEAGKELLNVGS